VSPRTRTTRAVHATAGRVRIIGGAWRGRLISFPAAHSLRPTPDRVRETLFNWLGQDLSGRRCLDLFAGSGVLGFEALSRGAAEAVLVEHSRAAAAALRENAARLGAGGCRVVAGDALHFLRDPGAGRFEVVFVDPPYDSGLVAPALACLPALLAPGAMVYVESDGPIDPGPPWRVRRQARAGGVHYRLLEIGEEA